MFVTSVEIERQQKAIRIIVKTSRPGLVIGRGGEGSQKLIKEIEEVVRSVKGAPLARESKLAVKLDIEEVRSPESQSPVVVYMVAEGLEKRKCYSRVLKRT